MSMESDVAVLRAQMNELLNVIKGNGKPGLDDRVRSIETKLNQHLEDSEEERIQREKENKAMEERINTKNQRKWEIDKSIKIMLVTIIVSQVVGLLIEVIKFNILR